MLTSQSCISQPSFSFDRAFEISDRCFKKRSLTDLAAYGSFFAQIGQEQEKIEFQSLKIRIGKTFVEQTIAFSNWWNQLETEVQERLTSIDL